MSKLFRLHPRPASSPYPRSRPAQLMPVRQLLLTNENSFKLPRNTRRMQPSLLSLRTPSMTLRTQSAAWHG